ncbi:MAG: HAD-IIB family hydrolase [Desulfobacterales bacterium]|nr:MAG: HAD-IIB family hydrolase [Desulfobacterales bacterium]
MDETQKILLGCDLDRTIIPNGIQKESPLARPLLRRLAEHPDIFLAYVSGRDKKLILDAIEEFCLPVPDYAIGDVGTTLYRIINGNWQLSDDWSAEIGQDWKSLDREELTLLLGDIKEIQLQEPEKQSRYKLSYYTDQNVDYQALVINIRGCLAKPGVRVSIIWSVDEIGKIGLLDIIPARANKLHAIRFLMQKEQFPEEHTVFAGDSGNDLDVLTSGLQAILVKNAAGDVRKQVLDALSKKCMTNRLYLPRGNFLGMNGNYSAGVLEGLAYFIPATGTLIAEAVEQIKSA